jgi:hypothetical protein
MSDPLIPTISIAGRTWNLNGQGKAPFAVPIWGGSRPESLTGSNALSQAIQGLGVQTSPHAKGGGRIVNRPGSAAKMVGRPIAQGRHPVWP